MRADHTTRIRLHMQSPASLTFEGCSCNDTQWLRLGKWDFMSVNWGFIMILKTMLLTMRLMILKTMLLMLLMFLLVLFFDSTKKTKTTNADDESNNDDS
jgi:uncharacterized membrane protein